MVTEVVEQSPVLAEALVKPHAIFGAELLDSILWRMTSHHVLSRTAAAS